MDRITRLHIFKLVAETLNFSRSAAASGLARSSITKAIKDLEEEVGARLLDRTTRNVALTPEGQAFLERSRDVLAVFDEAHAMFGESNARIGGRIRASVPSRMGRRVIVPALPAFFEEYPDIELELHVSNRQEDLLKQGLDFVLRVGDKGDSEFIARHLVDARMIICASPGYLERHGTPETLDDLDQHRAIGYVSPFTRQLWSFRGPGDGAPRQLRIAQSITTTNADTYIGACVAGLGLAQIPTFDIQDELTAGKLVEVLTDHPTGTVPIAIVYAHRNNLTPRVRVLVDWMSNLVRNTTQPM
ncbi:LysR substrate-binding domain-containing protein [Hasllibacter sp. MH4015]|uniref:LysR substrate-binding domain-containing protein n=1 Tax=Hasllibacter sp. MH4015 TaxID=2854029 RepID=UPI001CD57152|nr:LysR substrate-binding domain-containing protein [Hasllibacter sp. MH4015]